MKASRVFGDEAIAREAADFSDMNRAVAELENLTAKLTALIGPVADARTIHEFQGERQKAAFAKSVLQAFKDGSKSVAAAEYSARASSAYELAVAALERDFAGAERVRLEYETTKIKIDSLRTLVSAQKATFNL